MVDVRPFREALLKRRAQASTLIVFKSSDPKRLEPFVKFWFASLNALKSRREPTIFLYKVWSGLYKVAFSPSGDVSYEPVTLAPQRQQSPFMATVASMTSQKIRDLNQALGYLDQVLETSENVTIIFWGLFPYGNVSQSEYYSLVKFLRNAIFADEYYIRGHTIIIFTDDPLSILDEDTLKHSIYVEIPPSTEDERKEILMSLADQLGLGLSNGELDSLAEATRGLNLHETESVALESFFRFRKFDIQAMTAFKYDIVRKSGVLDIEEPAHGFEAVGGYEVVKEFIRTNIIRILRSPKKAELLGLRPPRGILLFGPPGTGKTWFARALAKELQLPFLRLKSEKIVSKWYGETTKLIAKALEIAESVAPAVLFIDEIDRFGRRGHMNEHEESRRAFSVLLEWLGDSRRRTIVVGTTNKPEDLDEAFIRVGRFDYIIPFLYPDFEARVQILKVHTSVVRKVPVKGVDFEAIARKTELWTGAELEELVLRAARFALREDSNVVTADHFEKALATFRIDFNARRSQLEHYLALAEQYTNDAEFLEQLRSSYSGKSRVDVVAEELGIRKRSGRGRRSRA